MELSKAEVLEGALKALAVQREALKSVRESIDSTRDELSKTELGQQLTALEGSQARLKELEGSTLARVRELALELYSADTSSKRVHKHVGIRVSTALKYDVEQITRYVRANFPQLMILDVKAFEKAAKQVGSTAIRFPDVELVPVPTAAIDSDLSDLLPAREESEA